VKVRLDGASVFVEGPKGKLDSCFDSSVSVELGDGRLVVRRKDDSRRARSIHGLTRKLLANMVHGVSKGFSRVLEINGVGYRAEVKGNAIHFSLGYSHPIVFQLPPGIQAKVDKQTVVTLESVDRQLLGEIAAMIRELRPPEPYKGKGIKYAEETIRRKAGKAAASAGA
jgi:large subunit ribosomal protein L6